MIAPPRRRRAGLAAAVGLALASGAGAVPPAPAPAARSVAAAPDAAVQRRSGLWQFRVHREGLREPAPMDSFRQCIDPGTDDFLQSLGPQHANECEVREVRRASRGIAVRSRCRLHGSMGTSEGLFTGRLDAGYRGELRTTWRPPFAGRRESRIELEATWLGPCPPGRRPGDIEFADGLRMNLSRRPPRGAAAPASPSPAPSPAR